MKELTGTVTDSAMEIDPPLEHNVQIENDNRVAMKKAPKTLKAIIEHLSRVPKNPFIIACVEPGVKDLRPAIRTCKSFKSKLHPDKGGPKDDRLPLISMF